MAKFSFEEISDAELIELYGSVMEELRERGIVRSANNPIADIAERIIADHYGVDPEPPNSKAYDVVAKDGTTIQVKALRRTKSSRRNLSPLRSLDFDYVAAVIFHADMQPIGAFLIPHEAVLDHMRWSKTWNAQCLSVTNLLQDDPRVEWMPATALLGPPSRGAVGENDEATPP
ncbi:MAG TPA: hypothetical protein VF731_11125 [Solirubrobacterales bacterium]